MSFTLLLRVVMWTGRAVGQAPPAARQPFLEAAEPAAHLLRTHGTRRHRTVAVAGVGNTARQEVLPRAAPRQATGREIDRGGRGHLVRGVPADVGGEAPAVTGQVEPRGVR